MIVTLIHPPSFFYKKQDILFPQCLGLLTIAGYLEKNNLKVRFIDALFEGRDQVSRSENGFWRVGLELEDIVERIDGESILIGISVPTSFQSELVHKLVDKVKERFPQIPIALGGIYPSSQPGLASQSNADYLLLGEGEETTLRLVNHILGGEDLGAGILCIDKLNDAEPSFMADLANLALPARHLVPFEKYLEVSPVTSDPRYTTAVISTSRGCPYHCKYCSIHKINGCFFRKRLIDSVVAEMKSLRDQYGVNHIDFCDDNLTLDRKHFIRLLDEINGLSREEPFYWSCSNGVRIDTLSIELLDKIAQSGCTHMSLALEHGSEQMLQLMGKPHNLEHALQVIGYCRNLNFTVDLHVICGYPGESSDLFDESVSYLKRCIEINPNVDLKILIAQPYPGTDLFEYCAREGFIKDICQISSDNVFFNTDYTVHIETKDFDSKDLEKRVELLRRLTKKSWMRKLWRRYVSTSLSRLVKRLFLFRFRKIHSQKG